MKLHITIIILQAFLSLSDLLVLAQRFNKPPRNQFIENWCPPIGSHVCQTESCKETAKRILQRMDTSVDPCDDFYKYACGNFLKHATILPDQAKNDSFLQLEIEMEDHLKTLVLTSSELEPPYAKQMKHLFSLCMNEAAMDRRGVSPLLTRLQAAGGWPVLGNWTAQDWSILRTESLLSTLTATGNIFFIIAIMPDLANNSHNVFAILEPSLGFIPEYLILGENVPQVKSYFSYMVDVAVIFGADRKAAEEQLREVLLMEIELAKLLTPREEKRDIFRMHNVRTLKQLMSEVSWFRWDKLLESEVKGFISIAESDELIIENVEYLKKLGDFVKKYPNRVLANYMMIRSVLSLSTFLTSELRNRHSQLLAKINNKQRQPRWKECLDLVQRDFPTAIGSMYVNRYFNKNSKKIASGMVKQIREEMRREILSADWMDAATRSKSIKKLDEMTETVGYPDELMDPEKVQNYYKDLNPNQTYLFEFLLDIAKWRETSILKEFKKPVDRFDWRTNSGVAMINAFYKPTTNSIVLPAGILQGSFFSAEVPQYVNFATIGFITGHEITHGFDDQGSQFDSKGNLHNWWDDVSKKNFNKKKQCFIDQYGKFRDEQTNSSLNGILTQGENIADNGGFKIALKAYKKWAKCPEPSLLGLEQFDTDQLFLLIGATLWCSKATDEARALQITTDTHSTPEFRVNGVFMNLPQFANIFQCANNTKMNPPEKCAVW